MVEVDGPVNVIFVDFFPCLISFLLVTRMLLCHGCSVICSIISPLGGCSGCSPVTKEASFAPIFGGHLGDSLSGIDF